MSYRILLFFAGLLLLPLLNSPQIAHAQSNSDGDCPALVEAALAAVDEVCADTERNQACYASVAMEAEAQPDAEDFRFEQVGDIVDVNDIARLELSPMNTVEGRWGVAMMRLQTSLPDTLPGQNVTFILFGDVELTNATDPQTIGDGETTPMQAFYLTTGVGDSTCAEAPDSGLLVQTPEGVGEITFTINNIEVEMGSTVLFQAQPEGEMIVSTVEGAAVMNINGTFHSVIAGTQVRVALDSLLRPDGEVSEPEAYDQEIIERLPIRALERPIEAQMPLTPPELQRLNERIQNGEPPCGVDPFPSCDHLPISVGGAACVFQRPEDAPSGNQPPLCPALPTQPNQLPGNNVGTPGQPQGPGQAQPPNPNPNAANPLTPSGLPNPTRLTPMPPQPQGSMPAPSVRPPTLPPIRPPTDQPPPVQPPPIEPPPGGQLPGGQPPPLPPPPGG
ncbi:MAG: hypothetical protein H7Y09_11520 [Chitinophagaceae bacterium]|nr:hypothetical protein [Anaerolineae bacterium]